MKCQLSCTQRINLQWNGNINGQITLDNVTIFLEKIDSEDYLLHPIPIVIKVIIKSNSSQKATTKFNVIIDDVLFNLSQYHCKVLLKIWNTYNFMFENKFKKSQSNTKRLNH